jgi:peptide/nickel transport system ATP-binding protein
MAKRDKLGADDASPLLQVENLSVAFRLREVELEAVRNVSFELQASQRMGLVGESGAGKSVTGFAIINLISKPGRIVNGRVLYKGRDLTAVTREQMRQVRGNRISMIFQDPMMTLNPVLTVGAQMMETLKAHKDISDKQARKICMEKLAQVYIPSPRRRLGQYPHEFSGGMRQRIVIAIALLTNPDLIIADEPTTALDVTIQAEIMELLQELCEKQHMGLILITHDLAVVSQVTEKIAVMYAGQIVEMGGTRRIVEHPNHPYTKGLLAALPQSGQAGTRLAQIPGVMPGLDKIPQGCPFRDRCEKAQDVCGLEGPVLQPSTGGSWAACHLLD